MKKWERIERNGIGRFGYEIFQSLENPERFWINIYIYDKTINLTGTKEIIALKIDELKKIFDELSKLFPNDNIPF